MPLEKTAVKPRIKGFGYCPSRPDLEGHPRVSGQVVVMDEKIKKGHFIKKGELLLKLDTRSYGLAESEAWQRL